MRKGKKTDFQNFIPIGLSRCLVLLCSAPRSLRKKDKRLHHKRLWVYRLKISLSFQFQCYLSFIVNPCFTRFGNTIEKFECAKIHNQARPTLVENSNYFQVSMYLKVYFVLVSKYHVLFRVLKCDEFSVARTHTEHLDFSPHALRTLYFLSTYIGHDIVNPL